MFVFDYLNSIEKEKVLRAMGGQIWCPNGYWRYYFDFMVYAKGIKYSDKMYICDKNSKVYYDIYSEKWVCRFRNVPEEHKEFFKGIPDRLKQLAEDKTKELIGKGEISNG